MNAFSSEIYYRRTEMPKVLQAEQKHVKLIERHWIFSKHGSYFRLELAPGTMFPLHASVPRQYSLDCLPTLHILQGRLKIFDFVSSDEPLYWE